MQVSGQCKEARSLLILVNEELQRSLKHLEYNNINRNNELVSYLCCDVKLFALQENVCPKQSQLTCIVFRPVIPVIRGKLLTSNSTYRGELVQRGLLPRNVGMEMPRMLCL